MTTSNIKPFLLAFEVTPTDEGGDGPEWAFKIFTQEDVQKILSLSSSLDSQPSVRQLVCDTATVFGSLSWGPLVSEDADEFETEDRDFVVRRDGVYFTARTGLDGTTLDTPIVSVDRLLVQLNDYQQGKSLGNLVWLADSVLVCTHSPELWKPDELLNELWQAVGEEIEYLDGGPQDPVDPDLSKIRDFLPTLAELQVMN